MTRLSVTILASEGETERSFSPEGNVSPTPTERPLRKRTPEGSMAAILAWSMLTEITGVEPEPEADAC